MNQKRSERPQAIPLSRSEESTAHAGTWPFYAADEIAVVVEVLESGAVNQWGGHHVRAFEDAMARRLGQPHAVAVANGSLALELALHALGIGPGDEVIVTPMSFIASAACVSLAGATPVFADIDPRSLAISPEAIAAKIGPRTRAIIPVHLAGWPADMEAIMALAESHDLLVIEDCAQAVGARIGERPAGSFGHASAVSFCRDKIISTGGEGGMALFRDSEAAERAWSYKDHGKSRALTEAESSEPGFRYVHTSIGTNWRLTEMQAAIGNVQLGKLDDWLARRKANADVWRRALLSVCGDVLSIPEPEADVTHAYYRLYVHLNPDAFAPACGRDRVLAALRAETIPVGSGVCPEIYLEQAFADLDVEPCPAAAQRGAWMLAFETHPGLEGQGLDALAERAAQIIAGLAKR